jgi:hypothetical protein
MTVHRSYPDADGNPKNRAICGKPLINGRWAKTQIPDCADCNNKAAHTHNTPQRGRAQRI